MNDLDTSGRPSTSLIKAARALDWPWLLERLLHHAGSALGQERVRDLRFTTSLEEARRLLQETSEVRRLLDRGKAPPLGGLHDIRAYLSAAGKGDVLAAREFGEIGETLITCASLRSFFDEHALAAPRVSGIASALPDLKDLARQLRDSFDAQGELSILLYPELGRLRKRIYAIHARVRDHLQGMLEDPEMDTLLQDRYYTVRSERYVIPIKVQHKNVADGIIHDASGSGQTVFIEPSSVIPLNNELKLIEGELKREERRILIELTGKVASQVDRIRAALEVAAELELINARARFSQELAAVEPTLNGDGRVRLLGARHPVLALRGVDVVPNDIEVGTRQQAIVISGPNTGGKTVALKTLGVCALMARAGLHLPVEGGSELALFRRILTDIGDTQTIEGDLSTFSGHITSIRDIVNEVDQAVLRSHKAGIDTLVLLDEIAVGTDPTQGAALARAILGALVDRGCRVVVTTHYSELKALSTEDPRFASARVDYDGLKPTYRLKMGVPGRSFALDIAKRLGLGADIIERAEGMLSPEMRKVDQLVGNLEKELHQAQAARDQATTELREAERLRKRYEERLRQVERDLERLRRDKIRAFEDEVANARKELRQVVKDLQDKPSHEAVETSRQRVRIITERVKEQAPKASEPEPEAQPAEVDWSKARAGAPVWLVKLKKEGTLAADPPATGLVEVLVGVMRTRVPREDVRAAPPAAPARKQAKREWSEVAAQAPSADLLALDDPSADPLAHAMQMSGNTLDLRGERVEAGLDAVDHFLDQASLRGEHIVFIIHGHGTGAMRMAVREHLDRSSYVDRHQPGGRYQGGNGVTVVALK